MPTITSGSDYIINNACKEMQAQINEQMTLGMNSGYPFPIFSDLWIGFANSLPDINEIARLFFQARESFDFRNIMLGVYSVFMNSLISHDRGFKNLDSDFFVFKNVRIIISNGISNIAIAWGYQDQVEDEDTDFQIQLIAGDPTHEVIDPEGPDYQYHDPTDPGGPVSFLPDQDDSLPSYQLPDEPEVDVVTPLDPGGMTNGGEDDGNGYDWENGYNDWGNGQAVEEEFPWPIVAAVGAGVVLIMLLKK